jgi:hypothetical protein
LLLQCRSVPILHLLLLLQPPQLQLCGSLLLHLPQLLPPQPQLLQQ